MVYVSYGVWCMYHMVYDMVYGVWCMYHMVYGVCIIWCMMVYGVCIARMVSYTQLQHWTVTH